MPKKIRGGIIVVVSVVLLTAGGCDRYGIVDYAPDAAFVKNSVQTLLFVALCQRA